MESLGLEPHEINLWCKQAEWADRIVERGLLSFRVQADFRLLHLLWAG